jgi:hypothetical protein
MNSIRWWANGNGMVKKAVIMKSVGWHSHAYPEGEKKEQEHSWDEINIGIMPAG